MMARRWERSPRNRKRFMVGVLARLGSGRQAGGRLSPAAAVLAGRLGWGTGEGPSVGSAPGKGLWEGEPRRELVVAEEELGRGRRAGGGGVQAGGSAPEGGVPSLGRPLPGSSWLAEWALKAPARPPPGNLRVAGKLPDLSPAPPGSLRLS